MCCRSGVRRCLRDARVTHTFVPGHTVGARSWMTERRVNAVTQSWPSGDGGSTHSAWPASMAGNCPFQQSSHRYSTCHKRNACRRPRTSAHATSDIDTRYGHPTPSRPGSSDRNVIPNQPCGFDFRYSLGLRIAPPMGLRSGPRRCSAAEDFSSTNPIPTPAASLHDGLRPPPLYFAVGA